MANTDDTTPNFPTSTGRFCVSVRKRREQEKGHTVATPVPTSHIIKRTKSAMLSAAKVWMIKWSRRV